MKVSSLSCRLVKQLFLPQVMNNITGNHRIHSFKLSFKRLSSPTLFSFSIKFSNKIQFKGVYPMISCDIIHNLREKKLFN